MRICLIHNEYGKLSGEEIVVNRIIELLCENDHDVTYFHRSSAEIPEMRLGMARAFFSAIHSPSSKRAVRILLEEKRPDIVHIHNLFPFISPSILPEFKRAGIPVVMTVHNYRLVCPNGLHMVRGQVCEKCCGGHEYWCVLQNCEGNLFKSIGYAFRNWFARKRNFFLDNVTMYATLTHFQRQRLKTEGFPIDRIKVIPNMASFKNEEKDSQITSYVGFIGRISPEKGILTLIGAAKKSKDISFKIAGSYEHMPNLKAKTNANINFLGHLSEEKLNDFYKSTRMIVLPSTCFEGFPMVLAEGMLYGKPVICSRIGGLSEIVEDGVTGLLFEPGNAKDLASKIRYLWDQPDLCRKMGQEGRKKALREYSPEKYYERLMDIYRNAIELQT